MHHPPIRFPASRPTRVRRRAAPVLALGLALATGCSGGGDAGSDTESDTGGAAGIETPAGGWFPAEKGPEDFPGIAAPAFDGALPRPGRRGPVWLVGVDGATWDLIRPMMDAGQLPTWKKMVEGGAHGVLVSERPTISPALWATIATGVPRFRHGIVNFVERRPGTYRTVEAGPRNRRAPALWELVGAAGGRSAVVSWFGSFPAEHIAGQYVSKGFDPERPGANQTWPPELGAELQEALRRRIVMRRGDLASIGVTEFLRDTLLNDARTLAAMRALAAREPHDLFAVYLAGIDVAQHVTWGHMEPDSRAFDDAPAPDPRLTQAIPGYYRFVDAALAEILELAGDDGTVVVVSDHGGGPLRPERAFHLQLEVLLETMGAAGPDGAGPLIAIGELYRDEKRIWIDQEGVEPDGGVPGSAIRDTARDTARRLRAMRTGDGDPLFAAVENLTLDEGWKSGDPALVVRFADAALTAAVALDGDRRIDMDPVRLRHTDVTGGHRLEGIALLYGRDVAPGPLQPGSIYRIAPTVLELLGLPQDRRMLDVQPTDGGVWSEALSADLLREFPVRAVPEYPGTDRTQPAAAWDAEDPAREEQLERLRGLGYVR